MENKRKKIKNIFDTLNYVLFIVAMILLSVFFVLKMLSLKKPKYKYVDLEGKEGTSYKCLTRTTSYGTKSQQMTEKNNSLIFCKLENGKEIQVKEYRKED